MNHQQEVKVHTRGPDGGNSTPKRQGRWPGVPGPRRRRSPTGSARGRLVEVIGAWPYRAQAKRRKAAVAGELASSSDARNPLVAPGVVATGWSRSWWCLLREVCWVPPRR
jgi:hypothetical protein